MADILVTSPYRPFTLPNQFKAVFNGCIYCGTVDAVDPSTSQVQVYKVNEDGSRIQVAQPLRTNAGGYLVYNGQPAKFVTNSNHSLLVRDAYGALVWYAPDVSLVDPDALEEIIQAQVYVLQKRSFAEAGYNLIGYFEDGVTFVSKNDIAIYKINGRGYTGPIGAVPPGTDPTVGPFVDISHKYLFANVRSFGAIGDGVADDTAAIQLAFDSGIHVILPEGRFKVSKTAGFASDFPSGDQPCLYVRDKDGFTISGNGEIFVENHGQGIIEVQRSKRCNISGIKLSGPRQFPQIDGTTGMAEKGDSSGGYAPTGPAIWQVYKNNSLNTSAYASGGYGGNFPQFGGGTASTWGVWNNGFIGNAAFGILIHNACDDVSVSGCDISGFNFAGVAVGFYGDYFPVDRSYPRSKNIRVHNNHIYEIYDTGVSTIAADQVIVYGNNIEDIGHPNSDWSHTNVNPGYGYASRGNDFEISDRITVSGNSFIRCRRKGIDTHGGTNIVITGNTVNESYYQGIFFNWSSPIQKATGATIANNIISNIKFDGVFVSGTDTLDWSYENSRMDCSVTGNVITNCDRAGVYVLSGRDVSVTSNIIKYDRDAGATPYGIYLGSTDASRKLYNLAVTGNVITSEPSGQLFMGISAEYLIESIITGNNIRNVNGNGLRMQNQCSENMVTDNVIRVGTGKINLQVSQTGGRSTNNITIGGNGVNVANDGRSRLTPETITIYVTFNGTASPEVVRMTGGDNIVSVASTSSGFVINMQGIGSSVKPLANIWDASDLAPLSGSTRCNYKYQIASTSSAVRVGIKADSGSTGHIPASSITSGQFLVRIELV